MESFWDGQQDQVDRMRRTAVVQKARTKARPIITNKLMGYDNHVIVGMTG